MNLKIATFKISKIFFYLSYMIFPFYFFSFFKLMTYNFVHNGTAINGKIENGKFFLRNYGEYYETTEIIYQDSLYWENMTYFLGFLIVFLFGIGKIIQFVGSVVSGSMSNERNTE